MTVAPFLPAKVAPEGVLHQAHDDVCRHVVRVVPAPQLQVRDVRDVQRAATHGPEPQHALSSGGRPVQPEDADGRVIHAVQDAGTGGEVVELLGDSEVADVEDGTKDPGGDAEVREQHVILSQRVAGGDGLPELGQAVLMSNHIT